MWWRLKVIQGTVISAAVASGITWILVTLMLLPALTDGPDAVHYLERTECTLRNITYPDNFCPRDTSEDFSNLVYQEDWEKCLVVRLNSTTDLGIDCYWYHPGSYQTKQEALIAVSENFRTGMKYTCVLDTIKSICFPDKREVLWFSVSVGSLFFLTVSLFITFCLLKANWKDKER